MQKRPHLIQTLVHAIRQKEIHRQPLVVLGHIETNKEQFHSATAHFVLHIAAVLYHDCKRHVLQGRGLEQIWRH